MRFSSSWMALGIVIGACGGAGDVHDAGHDAPRAPPDAWFGDTHAGDTGACASTPTSDQVAVVFATSCALPACHSHTSPEPGGGLELDRGTPRSNLVGVTSIYGSDIFYVIPGDPEHSFVWRKLTNALASDGTEGAPMPQNDVMNWVSLPGDQLELVRCWIAGGAP